jgi:hypothetical protein
MGGYLFEEKGKKENEKYNHNKIMKSMKVKKENEIL